MKKWNCSYAYDVPHYFDFVVEAENKKEALKKIHAALDNGVFGEIAGTPCVENWDSEADRVFVQEEADEDDGGPALVDGKLVDESEVAK